MEGGPIFPASFTGAAELVFGKCGQLPTKNKK
jgi:hypothetical protein